jgi:TolA-binding protein
MIGRQLFIVALLAASLTLSTLIGQQSSSSTATGNDAFFLDLGVVIEPASGKEKVDRYIKSPPEEVSFFVDKKPSGSIYMASTKELHATLQSINEKISGIEVGIHNEIEGLKEENFRRMNDRIGLLEKALGGQMETLQMENKELRTILSDFLAQEISPTEEAFSSSGIEVETVPPLPGMRLDDYTEVEPEEDARPSASMKKPFNRMVYMNGVLAYQREDYDAAVGHFERLSLSELDDMTTGNILYWLAECHFRLRNYAAALRLLDKVDILFESDKRDDAMALMGMVHREMGNNSEAEQAFAEIIDLFPKSEFLRLAQMELRKGSN